MCPGLKVAAPTGRAADAKGLLKAAIRDPEPGGLPRERDPLRAASRCRMEPDVVPIGKAQDRARRTACHDHRLSSVHWSGPRRWPRPTKLAAAGDRGRGHRPVAPFAPLDVETITALGAQDQPAASPSRKAGRSPGSAPGQIASQIMDPRLRSPGCARRSASAATDVPAALRRQSREVRRSAPDIAAEAVAAARAV
jgi:hypothetical protein